MQSRKVGLDDVRPNDGNAAIAVCGIAKTMPLDSKGQQRLRAAIRRWAQAVRDTGHYVPEE